MTSDKQIIRALKLHWAIMQQLEAMGMEKNLASRESMRRLQAKKLKFDNWEDYFTAVEREGFSLTH